jgi:hypothetical protein
MIRKLFFLAASLVIGLPLYATLTPAVTFSGHIRLSTDALGTNESAGGPIRFNKPTNNSTVRAAYLLAASTGFTEFIIPDNQVVLNGTPIVWDPTKTIANGIDSYNHWADVTNILRGPLNGAVAGIGSFVVSEGSATYDIDGTILAVIWDDPSLPLSTITLLYGAESTTGDSFVVTLAQPIDKNNPATLLDMSLGISYGYQSPDYDTGQWSYVELGINGTTISESAGGQDDGQGANGALITVGGIGDTDANPDPTVHWIEGLGDRTDDELYSVLPFVNNGDSSFTVYTLNPSNDDNIFFAGITLGGNTAIVGEGILLSPASSAGPVNTHQTVTGHVQNASANPIVGRLVTFKIISGPNVGLSGTGTTNASGNATFTYSSALAGSDTVEATMINSESALQVSNLVSVLWQGTNAVAVSLTLGPTSAANALNTHHTLTAKFFNSLGQPLVDKLVMFKVTAGPNTGLVGTGTTDATGAATFTYTSTLAGTDTIEAQVNYSGVTITSNPVSKTWALVTSPTIFLTNSASPNPVNGRDFLTARVYDHLANLVPNVVVTFKVNSGPNSAKTVTGTTDATGSVTVFYDDLGGAGTDNLTASGVVSGVPVTSAAISEVWAGLLCDADGNSQIDSRDILLIQNARNTLVLPGDPRDADFNGIITATDARKCVLSCKNAGCTY